MSSWCQSEKLHLLQQKCTNQHLGLSLLRCLLLPNAEGINVDPRSWMISFTLADRIGSQETGAYGCHSMPILLFTPNVLKYQVS